MKKILTILFAIMLLPSSLAFELDVLNTDPAPITAGEYGDITIRISEPNTDITYENMVISVEETNAVKVLGQNEERIGSFNSAETITRTFRLFFADDLPSGNIDIDFTIETDSGDQLITEQIFVKDAKSLPDLRVGQVESTPEELLQDTDDNKLIVTVQNLGETEAELVSVELQTESEFITPATSFSMIDSVSSIEEGDEAELEFEFDIEEGAQEDIGASLQVRYRSRQDITDSYRTFKKTIPFSIPLAKSPFLEVINVEADKLNTGTTDNVILVTVQNNGEKEAEAVRIRLHPDISYPFVFDATTHYIASELQPGEQGTISLEAEVTNAGLTRSYQIEVELESLVGETLYSREDTMSLEVVQTPSISNRTVGLGIILLVVLIAILFGVYNKFIKKKK